jgi:cobalamin biosynthesis protein CobW
VQGVGARVELAFARPGAIRRDGLVVIGLKGLDEAAVTAVLAS